MAVEVGGDVAPRAAVLGGAVRGELGMVVRGARGPRASWRASGGSRRGGSATTPAGSCGTSRRGGRTPTGRTPCRARRRRGATTTRGSPSRGSRSPSGPTGRISWPCRRWSNRELANLRILRCLHVCPQRCSSVHECPKTAPRGHFSQSVYTLAPPPTPARATGRGHGSHDVDGPMAPVMPRRSDLRPALPGR